MPTSLTGRSFLKLLDFEPAEIERLIEWSARFKAAKAAGRPHRYLEGRNIVLLFEKTSTRTRCSFEVAAADLGMGVTYLNPESSQMGKKESIVDTARVLGRMYDGIAYRGFDQSIVDELAAASGVPVFNALTEQFHPTQMIADMLTIRETFGSLAGRRLTFFGDAENNVANSLMVACAKLGMHFTACGPADLMPAAALQDTCRDLCRVSGGSITCTDDVAVGARDADVVYTDIWLSMGEAEDLWGERIAELSPFRVTEQVMAQAAPDAIFMHCLPSFHNTDTVIGRRIAERFDVDQMEVSDAVFNGERSRVFDEAENRMHSIKAIMYATLSDGHDLLES